MTRDRPARLPQAGFTLVELLVALVLVAMLSAALFAALRAGAGSLDRVADDAAGTARLAAADDVLRRVVEAAYPEYRAGALPGMAGSVAFDGDSGGMRFLAPAPAALAPGGLAEVEIAAVADGAYADLMIAARPELAWPGRPAPAREVLAREAASVRFAYWGADTAGGAAYWHTVWRDRAALPRLIRVAVTYPAGDQRRWPDLIIATRIRADQGCQFVMLTQSCLGR